MFDGFPHLLQSVIQNPATGFRAILELECLMERRLALKESVNHRFYPMIVCFIDEFSSLVGRLDREDAKQFATAISNLVRSGRNADIHLVMAIHNPIKDNTGGCDLNNATARIAFKCSSTTQSTALIGNDDAKTLVRKGEMIFRLSEDEKLHLQGANIEPEELERVLDHARSYWNRYTSNSSAQESPHVITEPDNILQEDTTTDPDHPHIQQSPTSPDQDFIVSDVKPKLSEKDKLFADIIVWTLGYKTISCRMIERQFQLGYARANDFLERLHEAGIVGDKHEKLPRTVLSAGIEDLSPEIIDLLLLAGKAVIDHDTAENEDAGEE
jgi:S-DNA-T family DNA segregation ATPase FtsK/SpoIIIE